MNYPQPVGPYSAYSIQGNTIYFSGQIGLDPETMTLEETLSKQTQRICENIKAICAELDIEMSDICKTSIFLTDMGDFERVNGIYGIYFPHKPARSCVQVSALPKGALIEIEVIACKQ